MKHRKISNPDGNDYISDLSDDILSNVLSRLHIKDAVKTCVLSKDWKFKWTSIYNLKIVRQELLHENGNDSMITNILERLLGHIQNVKTFKFESSCSEESVLDRITKLISDVLQRGVQCFELEIRDNSDFLLPHSLLNCTSLRKLELHFETTCTFRVPGKTCFPNLEILYLRHVQISNELSSTDTLIFTFPVLKTLLLSQCKWVKVKFVEFHALSLREFSSVSPVEFDNENDVDYTIKVIGATISHLTIDGGYPEKIVMIDLPVATAEVGCSYDYVELGECGLRVRKLLREIPSLKCLTLCSGLMPFGVTIPGLSLPRFGELKELSIYRFDNFAGLLGLLHAAPFLKSLDIYQDDDESEDIDYDLLVCVPSCVVHHLEKVTFYYDECPTPIYLLHKFLIKNGARLENIFISNHDEIEKNEMVEILSKFPKASATLKINGRSF